MNTDTYEKSYVEVLEILKHIPEIEYNKIPKEKIDFFKKNCDKEYKFIFEEGKMTASRKAYAIIINLYYEYIATDKQKKIVENALKYNNEKLEQIKKEKYSFENIFNAPSKPINEIKEEPQKSLIVVEENSNNLLKRILNFVKHFFNSNNT